MKVLRNLISVILVISNVQICKAKDMEWDEKFKTLVLQQEIMAYQQEAMVQQQKIMEKKIQQLEYQLGSCNNVKNKEKRMLLNNVEQTTGVAFDAILTHDLDHSGITDTTIVFDQVLTNIGNAYQKDVGIFTAPVKGIYLFTYTIHANYAADIFGSLTVDGNKMTTIHVDSGGTASFIASASRTVIVSLNEADRAYIQIWKNSRGLLKSYQYGHTAFAGALLFATN